MIWKTQHGVEIPIVELDDNHLLNVRRFVYGRRDKRIRALVKSHAETFHKHGARHLSSYNEKLEKLDLEIKRRGLDNVNKRASIPEWNEPARGDSIIKETSNCS